MAVCVFCGKKEIGPFPLYWRKMSVKLTAKKNTGSEKRAYGGGVNWVACNTEACKSAVARFHDMVIRFSNNVEGGVRENLRSRKV